MTEDFRGPSLMRDDELTTTLREIYAAPAESAYWSGLEARIMSRVSTNDIGEAWYVVPEKWLRIGLVAAGFAVLVAGSLLMRNQTQYARAEYETIIDPSTIDAPTLAARERMAEQATIRALTGR
ncbi:MAG: hypothetical protein WCL36_09600 [bacterium]|jgi:hypothetical protein